MNARDRHQQVSALFRDARELPPELRLKWLESATNGDASLRADVEALLARDAVPAAIDTPALGTGFHIPSPGTLGADPAFNTPVSLPERIGNFTIKRLLSRGGMGLVCLAEQDRPKRLVAVKVMRSELPSELEVERFKQEAETLGQLAHPGIARIYEAGTHPMATGDLQYFAMELVDGVPITQFAADKGLDPRQRLHLLVKVCDAVHHAHLMGVVHRDLKPSNIMVDGKGDPKVLDFGIARIMDPTGNKTIKAEIPQIIGTLPYMSPEQMSGDAAEVDKRSDVYALGVLAYELLSGRLPHDFKGVVFPELSRIIRDVDPPPLSRINKAFRGDIETLVSKALSKNKARRYQSAAELSADITRFLNEEPIRARPASTWYQTIKLARRHRVLVAGVSVTMIALLVGAATTTWQALKARHQRDVAREATARANERADAALAAEAEQRRLAESESRARKRAEDIRDFVIKALQSSDPIAGGAQGTTVAEAMANVLAELDSGVFRGDPETEAELRDTVATILLNNGRAVDAEPLYVTALVIRQQLFPGDHPIVAKSLNNLAVVRQALGRFDDAEPLYVEALAMRRRLFSGDHPSVALGINNVAEVMQASGRLRDAEPLFVEALAMRQRLFAGDHADVANSLNNLAYVRILLGRAGEAEPLLRRALEMRRRLYPNGHPDIAQSLNNLGRALTALDRTSEAEQMYAAALQMNRTVFKGDHPDIANSLSNLGHVWRVMGRTADAEPLFVEALEMNRRLFPGDHPNVANSLSNLAGVRHAVGHSAEAEELFAEALAMNRRLFKGDHPNTALSLSNLASTRHALGRLVQAEPIFVEALEMYRRLFPGDHPSVALSLNNLGALLCDMTRVAEARPLFAEALAMRRRVFAGDHSDVAISLCNLARTEHALGEAKTAQEDFAEAVAMLRRLFPNGSPALARALWRSGAAQVDRGDPGAALPQLEEAVAFAEQLLPAGHPMLVEYRETLTRCQRALDGDTLR